MSFGYFQTKGKELSLDLGLGESFLSKEGIASRRNSFMLNSYLA
jgi:hypothetical protein